MPARLRFLALTALLLFGFTLMAQSNRQLTRPIPVSGSTAISATPLGNGDAGVAPEIDPAMDSDAFTDAAGPGQVVNRTIAKHPGSPISTEGRGKAKANPELQLSFHGLDHFNQRFSNGGNQFSIEPPDQGLCVGNGYVLETINDVLSVYDPAGNLLKGPTDLNTFYGYIAAINRTTGAFGPEITDPSCYYDAQTQRWFHVVLTLDRVGTTSALSGKNHLDVAVSNTPSPLGSWTIYQVPVQDDGTDGTPDHSAVCNNGPCLGDYPHIGADANGFYITTNEFPFFGAGFNGAQIYAFSKAQLAAQAPTITVVQFDTADPTLDVQLDGNPGFTVWPATATGGVYDGGSGGTEFLLSSEAVFQDSGMDNRLRLWTLTNTSSLNSETPALGISTRVINTIGYSVPGRADQKPGDVPLAQCLSDSSLSVGGGLFGCWRLVVSGSGPFPNTEKLVDANDSRMQQVSLANGKLWASLDTAVLVGGQVKAGIAYFVLNPNSGNVFVQGIVGMEGNNLSYPAIAVTQSGRGVMAFSVMGADFYPSTGYAGIDAKIGVGDIHIAAQGAGPDDGFTGYHPFSAFGSRPRWGDYGAAVTDGNAVWIASEYVNQTCDYVTWLATNFRCGNTRTQLGNWGTRISKVVP